MFSAQSPIGGTQEPSGNRRTGGPLVGLRVIELAGLGPGPFCAMVFADLARRSSASSAPGYRQPLLVLWTAEPSSPGGARP